MVDSGVVWVGDATAATTVDGNADGLPDVCVAFNDLPPMLQARRAAAGGIGIRLAGPKGNPAGVGARIVTHFAGGARDIGWIRAGGGYLSQSAPVHFVGTDDRPVARVEVFWPDGSKSEARPSGTPVVTVAHGSPSPARGPANPAR